LNLAILYGAIGELQRALHLSEDGLAIVQRVKNGWGLALHQYHRGLFFAETGDYPKAVTWFEQAMETAKRVGDSFVTVIFQTGLASVLYKQGHDEAAQYHFREAVALARKDDFRYQEGILFFCQGEIAWARGDYPEASQHYQAAFEAGQETQSDVEHLAIMD
jgi:tetratricopeptide (TPR) repeat protein